MRRYLERHSQIPLLRKASDPLPPPAHGFALLPQSVQYTSELLVVPRLPKLTGVRIGIPISDVAVMFPVWEPSFILKAAVAAHLERGSGYYG